MRCVQHVALRTARGGGSSLKDSEAVSKAGGGKGNPCRWDDWEWVCQHP